MVQIHTNGFHEGSKMRVKTILRGGLGNQLFQYATARAYAEKYGMDVCLGTTSYNDQNRKYPYPLSITNYNIFVVDNKITNCKVINEQHYHYNPILESLDPEGMDVELIGYWQSEKYFKNIRDILINNFNPKKVSPRVMDYLVSISSHPTTYVVAVHIRRGERVYEEEAMKTHGLIPWSYYEEAMARISKMINNEHILFIVFSDDIDYAMTRYQSFPGKIIYIYPGPDWEDLFIMSQCNHAIVANSSFSWWGAWLIRNKEKIIISPDMWVKNPQINTKDVIPEDWIKIYTKLI